MPACSLVNVFTFWFGVMTGNGVCLPPLGGMEAAFVFVFFGALTVCCTRARVFNVSGMVEGAAASDTWSSCCVSGIMDDEVFCGDLSAGVGFAGLGLLNVLAGLSAESFFFFRLTPGFLTAGRVVSVFFTALSRFPRSISPFRTILEAADSAVQYPLSTRNFVKASMPYPCCSSHSVSSGPKPLPFRKFITTANWASCVGRICTGSKKYTTAREYKMQVEMRLQKVLGGQRNGVGIGR